MKYSVGDRVTSADSEYIREVEIELHPGTPGTIIKVDGSGELYHVKFDGIHFPCWLDDSDLLPVTEATP